MEKKSR